MYQEPLKSSVEFVKGIGPKRAELLNKELGIFIFEDLMQHYPFRYVDRNQIYPISSATVDQAYVQVKGKITEMKQVGQKRGARFVAKLSDDTGSIELIWFQGIKWIKEKLVTGNEYIVFGKPGKYGSKINMAHPEIETLESFKKDVAGKLQPFYSSTEKLRNRGLDSKGITKVMRNLMDVHKGNIPETLPGWMINRFSLPSKEDAIINVHFPKDEKTLEIARKRLIFEELFFVQLGLLRVKHDRYKKSKGHIFHKVGENLNTFYKDYLPFELTNAQKRVVKEIRHDLGNGHQMNRLLQGDVGSGKTLVGLLCMLIAIDNGFQTALMAPTEILALQHYNTISGMLSNINVRIGLLTGSTKTAERRLLDSALRNGEIDILLGTHALIEEKVVFKNLGLAIIDEQHRFGVAQRAKLWKKNEVPPHVLVMTATPIPRTLSMTLYGDLDLSVIDELPPGRKPVKTVHYTDAKRLKVFGFMKEQIAAGHQVYVVYPLIEESAKLDLKDLMDGFESISRAFPLPEYAVSIVHGKMKSNVKEYEMQRFVKGETQIMVSTTVIEVGVDVANASVMVIENAERFGLSQLHQLRGRVGRGAEQSFCILMSGDKLSNDGRKRIGTMVQSNDGFVIAEVDLRLRGPGDIQGTRQSGMLDFHIADLTKDEKIMKFAREVAQDIIDKDPDLEMAENAILKKELDKLMRSRMDWARIS